MGVCSRWSYRKGQTEEPVTDLRMWSWKMDRSTWLPRLGTCRTRKTTSFKFPNTLNAVSSTCSQKLKSVKCSISKVEKPRLLLQSDGDILMVIIRSTFRPKMTFVASSLVLFHGILRHTAHVTSPCIDEVLSQADVCRGPGDGDLTLR